MKTKKAMTNLIFVDAPLLIGESIRLIVILIFLIILILIEFVVFGYNYSSLEKQ